MNATLFVAADRAVLRSLRFRDHARETFSRRLNQALALILIVTLSPLMGLIAFLIWRRDGAPIIFSHYRVGLDGRMFRCLKFRTMLLDSDALLANFLANDSQGRADWERDHKLVDDPRITPVGKLLRHMSLDELPQLFNVFRGDMNLVGPRPITVAELDRYGVARWHYLSVMPGMTGLWQVSGRNNLSYDERVALDRAYVEQRTIATDMGILVKTVKVVARREGAR